MSYDELTADLIREVSIKDEEIARLTRELSEAREQLELYGYERSSAVEAVNVLLPAIGWSSGGLGAAAIEAVRLLCEARAEVGQLKQHMACCPFVGITPPPALTYPAKPDEGKQT